MANRINSSVIITTYNEQATVTSLINSLLNQTRKPQEIIVVDGGSTDNTLPILEKLSRQIKILKVYSRPSNRSQGRNYAVQNSRGKILAFTDAGCRPQPRWLENLLNPFSDPKIKVVSGYYQGEYANLFEKSLIPYILVMPDQVNPQEFLPSARSMAIRREVFLQSGGFDEKLMINEDYAFALWLKKSGLTFYFAPQAVVLWRPRPNLTKAAKMFFNYAMGDIIAGIFRPKVKMLIIRAWAFFFLFFLSFEIPPLLPWLTLLITVYLLLAIKKNYRYVRHPLAFIYLPIIQITADLSVFFGTLSGFLLKTP